jgi:hypothetical protein
MAKFNGTYSCGCEGSVNIIGSSKLRQYKADKHFEGVCTECFIKRQNEFAEKVKADNKLVQLEGSEKQVNWAINIRDMYNAHTEIVVQYNLFTQTKATFYIDNRHGFYINLEGRDNLGNLLKSRLPKELQNEKVMSADNGHLITVLNLLYNKKAENLEELLTDLTNIIIQEIKKSQ